MYTSSRPILLNSPRTDLSQSTLLDSSISGSVMARPASSCRKKARSSSVTWENGSRGGAALGKDLPAPPPSLCICRCFPHTVWQPRKTRFPLTFSTATVEMGCCETDRRADPKRSRLNRCKSVAIAEKVSVKMKLFRHGDNCTDESTLQVHQTKVFAMHILYSDAPSRFHLRFMV